MKASLPIIAVFLLGLYYYTNYSTPFVESFSDSDCPNLLIQKGKKIYLKNTQKAEVPGVNPIIFKNLEEYVEFLDWQKSQNIKCPVLYLKREYDTQDNEVYRIRPDMVEMHGGGQSIPAGIHLGKTESTIEDSGQQIVGLQQPFDPMDQDQGMNSPLDKLFNIEEGGGKSANPMDSNWGGTQYTQKQVDKGRYKGNEVAIYVP